MAFFLLLAGCAGDGGVHPGEPGDDPVPAARFERIQTEIFDANCQSAGCHNPQSRAGNLVLAAGDSWANLVGIAPNNAIARAAGLLRVTPFEPEQSFLVRKLEGPGDGEGSRMPLGQPPLTADQIALIRAWISEGAPPPASFPSPTPSPTRTPEPPPTSTPDDRRPTAGATHTPTPLPVPNFAALQREIFAPRCALVGCHTAAARSGELTLEGPAAYDELVGAQPAQPAARAAGWLRVAPFEPERSFLLLKLEGPEPRFGGRMPLIGDPLTPSEIDRVRQWIEAGAPR